LKLGDASEMRNKPSSFPTSLWRHKRSLSRLSFILGWT